MISAVATGNLRFETAMVSCFTQLAVEQKTLQLRNATQAAFDTNPAG